jgi:hypothetical protein
MDLPRSDLLDRLAAFMPKMADANAGLATAPVNVDGSLEVDEGDDGEAASSDGSSGGSESGGSESGDESGSASAEAANAARKAAAATAAAPGTVEMKFQIGAVDPELMRLLQDGDASADAAAAAAAAQPPPPPAALVMPWQAGADAGAAGATRLAEKGAAAPMIEEL